MDAEKQDYPMDYEFFGDCEYEVALAGGIHPVTCGENSIVTVWWQAKDFDSMKLCQKHFDLVKAIEDKMPQP